MLLRWCDTETDLGIEINEVGLGPTSYPVVSIPHGHYIGWVADRHDECGLLRTPGRILFFGRIRAYKGVESLVEAFTAVRDENISLLLMGAPDDDTTVHFLQAAAERDQRIDVKLGFAPESQLYSSIVGADLIALPYRDMQNSGALLLALSLGRPVLAPQSPVNESIREEVGKNWLLLYDGALTDLVLTSALKRIQAMDSSERGPDLSAREWDTQVAQVLRVYDEALKRRRQRSIRSRRR